MHKLVALSAAALLAITTHAHGSPASVAVAQGETEHDDPDMVTVTPGKSGEVIWRFTKAGKSGGDQVVSATEMAEGEVRKIDKETRKITLRHGPIQSLDMPGMTMVFQVRDPALLDSVKIGDRVRFAAEKMNGAMTVTNMEAVK